MPRVASGKKQLEIIAMTISLSHLVSDLFFPAKNLILSIIELGKETSSALLAIKSVAFPYF